MLCTNQQKLIFEFIAEYTIPYYQMESHDCQEMKLSYDMKKEKNVQMIFLVYYVGIYYCVDSCMF